MEFKVGNYYLVRAYNKERCVIQIIKIEKDVYEDLPNTNRYFYKIVCGNGDRTFLWFEDDSKFSKEFIRKKLTKEEVFAEAL